MKYVLRLFVSNVSSHLHRSNILKSRLSLIQATQTRLHSTSRHSLASTKHSPQHSLKDTALSTVENIDRSFEPIITVLPSSTATSQVHVLLPRLHPLPRVDSSDVDLVVTILSQLIPGLPTNSSAYIRSLLGLDIHPPVQAHYNETASHPRIAFNSSGRVIKLWLHGLGLRGSIPVDFSRLSELRVLCLNDNEISKEIPAGIFKLKNLEKLDLSGNLIDGHIPNQICDLKRLEFLLSINSQEFCESHYSFGVPKTLCFRNNIGGEIPRNIGRLRNLKTLNCSSNSLTGEIPASIVNLSGLVKLDLSHNQLSGHISQDIGSLTNLQQLYLNDNRLTGNIPHSVTDLTRLENLNLSNNQLIGVLSPEIGNMMSLTHIDLGNNRLFKRIPPELFNLRKLRILMLNDNDFFDEVPSEICRLTKLSVLCLGNNRLTGSILTAVTPLSNLRVLMLHGNRFTGSVPHQFGKLKHLQLLRLDGNALRGRLPASMLNHPAVTQSEFSFRQDRSVVLPLLEQMMAKRQAKG
ncbi:hypothetical protein BSLG_003681 [Batrachochytrium salamandrivorans]|nr:hypothetical protein BSLG_003681 [Batrachochytrium salamandrivorans]